MKTILLILTLFCFGCFISRAQLANTNDAVLVQDSQNPLLFHVNYSASIVVTNFIWGLYSSENQTNWHEESVGFDGVTATVFKGTRTQVRLCLKGTPIPLPGVFTPNTSGPTVTEIPAQIRFRELKTNPAPNLNLVGVQNVLIAPSTLPSPRSLTVLQSK